jgi:hypothetical protein
MRSYSRHLAIWAMFALFCIVTCVPVQLYNDPLFLDSEIRRIRAGKAGEPINKPPVIKGGKQIMLHLRNSEEYDGIEESGDGDDDEYHSSEEVDVTCAPGKGWHFRLVDGIIAQRSFMIFGFYRGQRCVPVNCPGGTDHRDFNTGECLHALVTQAGGRFKPYSHWNSLK